MRTLLPALAALALVAAPAAAPFAQSRSDDRAGASSAGEPSTWDKIAGNWTQLKGEAKEQWGRLTDDDLMQVQGKRQQLVGKIQARYGISVAEAEEQVTRWENKVAR